MASQKVLPDLFGGSININWKEGAPAPIARAQGCAVVLNKAIYVGGGFSGDDQENVRTIDVYDPDTDKWNTIDTPHALFAMTVLMNKLLVVGGMTGNGLGNGEVTNKVLALEDNRWKDYTEMPTARCMHTAVSHKSMMLVMGGQVGFTTLNTVELLDGSTCQWSKCDDLPKPLSFLQSVIVDGMVYVLGGVTLVVGENSPKTVYGAPVQNLPNLKWQNIGDAPKSLSAAVSLRNSYLLTLGGGQENADDGPEMKLFNEVFTFNPSSSSWNPISTLPLNAASPIASSTDSTLVVIGGVIKVDGKDDTTNKVWIGQFQ